MGTVGKEKAMTKSNFISSERPRQHFYHGQKIQNLCDGVFAFSAAVLLAVGLSTVASAVENTSNASKSPVSAKMCVYDPVGASGPVFSRMKEYQTAALEWGVSFELVAYSDERIAVEDFKSNSCDALLATGFETAQFNPFTGTLDSIGALPSYEHLKTTLDALLAPKAKSYMQHDNYEVVGLLPAGAAFLYVNDREVDTVQELAGQKIGILTNDLAQKKLVLNVGGSPIGSSLANLYPKFNNGAIDICAGPAVLYDAMELYKGIGDEGGIIRFPLAQLTLQMIIRDEDKFSPSFRQESRDFASAQFGSAVELLRKAEDSIPKEAWIDIPPKRQAEYDEMLRQARLSLAQDGIYDGKMLTLMRKIRCRADPTSTECSVRDQE